MIACGRGSPDRAPGYGSQHMTERPDIPIPKSVRPDTDWQESASTYRRDEGDGLPHLPMGAGVPNMEQRGNIHPLPSSLQYQPPEKTHRHSRFIRMMKLLLPIIAAFLIALVITWPQINTQKRFNVDMSKLDIAESLQPRMDNPRFTGIDKEGRPYSLTAITATQIGDSPELIALETPQIDITLTDNSWVVLTAKSGAYSENSRILGLRGAVSLYHDTGYEFRTESADIDISAGTASGGLPVAGQGPFGSISAQGFLILNKGERIVFTGKSHLIIYAQALDRKK